ncbi:MAG TPA: Rrf2 family transcriptional regulator [Alphaproteobacteria bacterium]|nr:Rrf2 family transcriptional regulator [Alphaproteobacteria bacterium]
MVNSKLTVGIHMLTLLAFADPMPLPSETIAGSVNTNPVVVRRLLALLRKAGFVDSNSGPGGGWRLVRRPEEIRMSDLRAALEENREVFPLHNAKPNAACPVGGKIQGVLVDLYDDAIRAVDRQLAKTTVADVLTSILTRPVP